MTAYDAQQLSAALAPRPIRYFEQVGSTNDLALAWLRAGAVPGSAIIADVQTAGRGRRGHEWVTPPGEALAVSVILKPERDHLMRLSMVGALAIAELAESLNLSDVVIKWPNDVLIQGRKVSGVLPEAEWDGDRLLGTVLGLGINVRVDFRGTALEDRAISLETVAEHPLNRIDLLRTLLDRVDYWAEHLESAQLPEQWRGRLVTLGQRVEVDGLQGLAESVDDEGALWLRLASGGRQRVLAGDLVSN